jgi:deoxyribose-phosphate aldolase
MTGGAGPSGAQRRDESPPHDDGPSRAQVARLVDHTLLRPEATAADVAALVDEARRLGVLAVCVSPSRLPLEVPPASHPLLVATVCGFPSGAHDRAVKAAEAAGAVAQGADEIDMVLDLGTVKAGDWAAVEADVAEVRAVIPAPRVLKVIIESAALSDAEIVAACRAAESAGADFVKTSTGFHPAGGASVHAVTVMAATVGGRLGVKASGGIRTAGAALALLRAGATRLGLSGPAAVLDGLPARPVTTRGEP